MLIEWNKYIVLLPLVTHSTAVLLEMRLGKGLCQHLIIGDRRHQTLVTKSRWTGSKERAGVSTADTILTIDT